MKFYRDKLVGIGNVHSKFQVSRTSGSLFLYCKILQNCNFLYLFERGYHKNQYNEMKLYKDKLMGMKNLMRNFKFPGHQKVCFYTVNYCKIVIFFTFFWAWLLQKSRHWHEILQGQTNGSKERTFQISSLPDIRKSDRHSTFIESRACN